VMETRFLIGIGKVGRETDSSLRKPGPPPARRTWYMTVTDAVSCGQSTTYGNRIHPCAITDPWGGTITAFIAHSNHTRKQRQPLNQTFSRTNADITIKEK
jgi:hypothetical protein